MMSTQPRAELLRLPAQVRHAVPGDLPALTTLIDRSMRELGSAGYSQRQIESALLYLTVVDPRLITDGTYFVAESGGEIVGGGGWTRRPIAHGTVRREHAAAYRQWLAATGNAAWIRAVYVDPRWARQGIGRRLTNTCEQAAQHAGFNELTLLASVGGMPLYRSCGYIGAGQFDVVLPDRTIVPTIPMIKFLD